MDGVFWNKNIPALVECANVLTIDCRGHGNSSKSLTKYSIELFANDLEDVLNHLGWDDAVIVGASMGGSVSLAFAIKHPQRAKGLGLIDTTAWYGDDAPQKWAERATKAVNEGLAALVGFQKTRWFSESFINKHPEEVAQLVETFLANNVQCFQQTCTMLGEFDLRGSLKNLNLPTAIIVGEEDYATPVEMANYMHENIKNSSLEIIPKARHLTPIECSTEINASLKALIAKAYQ
jgi:3-oxoadipate enol-lactonase